MILIPKTIKVCRSYFHTDEITMSVKRYAQGVGVLILLLMGERLSAAPPDVFDDYFEQDLKVPAMFDLRHTS